MRIIVARTLLNIPQAEALERMKAEKDQIFLNRVQEKRIVCVINRVETKILLREQKYLMVSLILQNKFY